MNAATQANFWLNVLYNHRKELIPVYKAEMSNLRKLAPILPEKTVKDRDGNVAIFYIHKQKTIDILKSIYSFRTEEEATKELTDAATCH